MGLKRATSGIDGVGKSTLAGVLAPLIAGEGRHVLAINADPDANPASALGFPPMEAGTAKMAVRRGEQGTRWR